MSGIQPVSRWHSISPDRQARAKRSAPRQLPTARASSSRCALRRDGITLDGRGRRRTSRGIPDGTAGRTRCCCSTKRTPLPRDVRRRSTTASSARSEYGRQCSAERARDVQRRRDLCDKPRGQLRSSLRAADTNALCCSRCRVSMSASRSGARAMPAVDTAGVGCEISGCSRETCKRAAETFATRS